MNFKTIAAAVAMAISMAACQQIPEDMTVVEYCSNPDNINKDVCKVNVEVDGQRLTLSNLDKVLSIKSSRACKRASPIALALRRSCVRSATKVAASTIRSSKCRSAAARPVRSRSRPKLLLRLPNSRLPRPRRLALLKS